VKDFSEVLIFAPEIQAVDRAMRKPQGAVMLMIVVFAGDVLHRPVARHGQVARSLHWIAKRPGHILEIILGEKLAVDLDAQPVGQLDNLHARFRRSSRGFFGGDSRNDPRKHNQPAGSDFRQIWGQHNDANLGRAGLPVKIK
jgi:hypothetical protein